MMLRCVQSLRRSLVHPVRLVFPSKQQTRLQTRRSVRDYAASARRGPLPSGSPVAGGGGGGRCVEEVLRGWRRRGKGGGDSHEALSRTLYHVLEAARHQKLSSSQLATNPHFQRFWDHVGRQVPSLSANSAVMCLYNCAQYGYSQDLPLLFSLAKVCRQRVDSLPTKAYGILLWSLVRLDIYQDNMALVEDVVKQFHSQLVSNGQIKPQSFANVLWALASTGTWPDTITASVGDYVSRRAGEFDFHSLSIVLWSLTTSGVSLSEECLEATGTQASLLLRSCQWHTISLIHCCWAFGCAPYYHSSFFSAVADVLLSLPTHSPKVTPRLLSTVAWAFARTSYYHLHLMNHIAGLALAHITSFNSQDLGNLAYAYGQLNHRSEQLLTTISGIMSSRAEMYSNEQACANVTTACLIHKHYPQPLLRRLMSSQRVEDLIRSGCGRGLHLCAQTHTLVKSEVPQLEDCILQPPYDTIVPALVVADSMASCPRVYSVFHQNLCKALATVTGSSLGFTREALTTFGSFIDAEVVLDSQGTPLQIPSEWRGWSQPRSLLSAAYPKEDNPLIWEAIDLFSSGSGTGVLDVQPPEEVCLASDWVYRLGGSPGPDARRVALEADGPRHYAVNCRHKLGNTEIKHRLLRATGWDVIAIPHFDWEALKTDQDHINYLVKRLYTLEH